MSEIITPLAKGQITIPAPIRRKLKITENTIFRVEIKNGGIFLKPLTIDWRDKYIRDFSDEELDSFVKDDKLDSKSLKKIREYLK